LLREEVMSSEVAWVNINMQEGFSSSHSTIRAIS
jgi:hypothetical protein